MAMLDERQVEDLLALDKGKGGLLSAFVNALASNATDRIGKMNASVLSGEFGPLSDQAHALRGSAGNLGAVRLAALLEQIETAAKRRDLETARTLVARLEPECVATLAALRAICNRDA